MIPGPTSMLGLVWPHVEQDPDALLLVDADPVAPRRVSRGAFWRRVACLRAELAARGVGPGGCVAVWLPSWSDSLVWQFATVALGAHVIGINTCYNLDEVTHVLALARPAVVAVAHGFARLDLRERLMRAAAASGAPPAAVAVVAGPHGAPASAAEAAGYDLGAGAWVPAAPAGDEKLAALRDDPAQLAVAFTTSGSTGRPKLAAHRVDAVAGHARACVAAGGWTARSVTLTALPLTGVFSFVPAMATLAAGGACLLAPSFDADALAADMATFGVTHVIGGDDIVGRLADAVERHGTELPSWTRLFMADFNGRSDALSRWAETRFGVVAAGVYGSSELFALTSFWPPETPLPRRWRGGGVPVSPAIRVRAADPDTGDVLPPDTVGELQFRGPNVVDAYLGDPARRATVLTQDGWFRSGDLGLLTPEGGFEYTCRMGDVLRLKGFLVEPAEIETRLAAHDAVAQNKVVGVRGADGETTAVAFAVLRDGQRAEPAELVAWCAATLARYKVPRAVHLVPAMPVTSGVNGMKVRAATLRDWAAAFDANPAFVPDVTPS